MLVPEGFSVLALPYWGTPGTQFTLAETPQRVERGLRWLRAQPYVRTVDGRIGASRGDELALLAAATFPDLVGPVVGYALADGIDFPALSSQRRFR